MNMNPAGSLDEIAASIIANGKVTSVDLALLECHFGSSAVIDQNKADLLFQINSAVGASLDTCQQWQNLFCQSICRFVVYDMSSPGEIADVEAEWLNQQLPPDRPLTSTELHLIREIQNSASTNCEQMKGLYARLDTTESISANPEAQ